VVYKRTITCSKRKRKVEKETIIIQKYSKTSLFKKISTKRAKEQNM